MALNMEDIAIDSVDDHIFEPPTMFDTHTPKDCLARGQVRRRHYDEIGGDIVVYECDYPRLDCTWPDVAGRSWGNVSGLPAWVIDKISCQNVFDFFKVNPIAVGG